MNKASKKEAAFSIGVAVVVSIRDFSSVFSSIGISFTIEFTYKDPVVTLSSSKAFTDSAFAFSVILENASKGDSCGSSALITAF